MTIALGSGVHFHLRRTIVANASANPYLLAAGFGALVGARSMLGPMLISRALVRRGASVPRSGIVGRLASRPVANALTALAVSEMAGDKYTRMPNRTAVPLLGMRMGASALAGAAVGRLHHRSPLGFAAVALAAGTVATFATLFLRRRLARTTRLPLSAAGLVEDIAAVTAGYSLARKAIGIAPWASPNA